MRRPPVLAILTLLLVSGCMAKPEAPPAVAPDDEPPVRFVVVGDTGTGDANQYAVAAAIGKECQTRGCDFLVLTGDNMYDTGPTSIDDPQFETKYEQPYGSLGLPAYLVLGNHDVGGDPSSQADLQRWKRIGDLSVGYHSRENRTTGTWHMPARWYDFTQGPVSFAAFDTTALLYITLEADSHGPVHQAVAAQESFAAVAWPENATWRFSVGHHPYVSNGQHGDAAAFQDEGLDGRVLSWFYETHVCRKADFILAGHDHDLQWLRPVPTCGGTQFVVSGAGARPRSIADSDRHDATFQRGGTLGFWWMEARGDTLRLVAIDVLGQVLHEGTVVKPGAGNATPSPSVPSSASVATGT